MTKLERELDDQTQTNSKNLEVVLERTGKHYEKMQEDNKKQAGNATKQIRELTAQIVERNKKRDKAQIKRERK